MIYLCIPVVVLLFHLIYSLSKQHLGKEPLWVKIYAIIGLFFIWLVPIIVIQDLLLRFYFSNAIIAYGMLAAGIIMFLFIVNVFPKNNSKVG